MKKSTLYLFIITIAVALSSCATDPLLRTYVSGEWKPVKLGSLDIQKIVPDGDIVVPKFTHEDEQVLMEMKNSLSTKNADGTEKKSTSEDYARLIAEANTSYIFRTEGFGGRLNPETPIKGPWKLKSKGKRLILTDEKTKEKFVIIIDSLTSKRMVASNKYIPGGMKVTYLKMTDEAP